MNIVQKLVRSIDRRRAMARGRKRVSLHGITAEFTVLSRSDYKYVAGSQAEHEQIEALLKLLRPDDVVYDVGAHIGTFAVFVGCAVRKGCVHAFEPSPDNRTVLERNLALNHLSHAAVHAVALSDTTGTATLAISAGSGLHSLLRTAVHERGIDVPTLRLDEAPKTLGIEPPTVLKIDCEGAEEKILAGAQQTLDYPSLRLALLELHHSLLPEGEATSRRLLKQFKSRGFDVVQQWDDEADPPQRMQVLLERR